MNTNRAITKKASQKAKYKIYSLKRCFIIKMFVVDYKVVTFCEFSTLVNKNNDLKTPPNFYKHIPVCIEKRAVIPQASCPCLEETTHRPGEKFDIFISAG